MASPIALRAGNGCAYEIRAAHESRHKQVGGILIQVLGRADLLEAPLVHDGNTIG